MVNQDRVRQTRQQERAQIWFVGFFIAVIFVPQVVGVWHTGHDADPSCVVCKLVNQPLTKVSEDLQIGPADASELASPASIIAWDQTDQVQVPSRAPPLS